MRYFIFLLKTQMRVYDYFQTTW